MQPLGYPVTMDRIAPVVTRRRLHDQSTGDLEYWLRQPIEARIAMVGELRADYYGWRHGTRPRLQRVCRVLHRS